MSRIPRAARFWVALAISLSFLSITPAYATHYDEDEIGSGWNCSLASHAYSRTSSWDYYVYHHKTIYEGGVGVDETELGNWNGTGYLSYTYAQDSVDQNVSYTMSALVLNEFATWPGCIAD